MKRPAWIPFAAAAAAAALFVYLGLWQLRRHRERAALNERIEQRFQNPPRRLAPGRLDARAYERVALSGVPDYEHELALTHRSRNGSPGVYLITPVRLAGSDTAVLVNRGWVYSPDASSVEHPAWREGDLLEIEGWVEPLPESPPAPASSDTSRAVMRTGQLRNPNRHPYPVTAYLVVAGGDTTARAGRPARLGAPSLDGGPHLGYMIQWFAFAVIAVGGTGIWYAKERASRRGQDRPAA